MRMTKYLAKTLSKDTGKSFVIEYASLDNGTLHGCDCALLHQYSRHGYGLECLFCYPFRPHRQSKRSFILLSGLEHMWEIRSHKFCVLTPLATKEPGSHAM